MYGGDRTMKKIIVGLIILYICISYPGILLLGIIGLCIWYIGSAFLASAAKTPAPTEKSAENHIEGGEEAEFYNREGKPIPDVPVPAGPITDPRKIELAEEIEKQVLSETDAKQAIPATSDSIESETD